MEKFAAIDFETANWQQTSVCSVGIVVMNRGAIEDRFYSLIHPAPNFYSRRNTAIHGSWLLLLLYLPSFPEVI